MAKPNRIVVVEEELSDNPIQGFAMVFLHRELTQKGEIILTVADFEAFESAVADRVSGGQFDTNERQDIILRPVKKVSDA